MTQPKCTCGGTSFEAAGITPENHTNLGKFDFLICSSCGTIIESLGTQLALRQVLQAINEMRKENKAVLQQSGGQLAELNRTIRNFGR